jgi:uncharacterized membrane protein YjfL (UPF0719 family)
VNILSTIGVVVIAVLLVWVACWVQRWLYGHTLKTVLSDHDNIAVGIAVSGYFFSVIWTLAVLGSSPGRGVGWLWDMLDMLLYGVLSIALLTGVGLGSCRFFLGLHVHQELVERHNIAAAIVVAGVYVATSLTYSGALSGEGGGWGILLLFFVLGQLALLGVTHGFRWLTSYDDVQEIAAGNAAAAFALGGLLIAAGLIVSWAVSGSYTGFLPSLGSFVLSLLDVLALYLVRQVVVECVVLGGPIRWRGSVLDSEIAQDKNVAAGLLEATAYVTAALFVTAVV